MSKLRIAILSPIAWRTPPRNYGPWEQVVSWLTEGLVAKGNDVTLFATGDSLTAAKLHAVCPVGYGEKKINTKVWEHLHISEVYEQAAQFDIIHNHFDFVPLTYSQLVTTPVVTTIHGFSSPEILPVYQKYNNKVFYVSISNADRDPSLNYLATVYHGINLQGFTYQKNTPDTLLFFGRIHPDKGTKEAIEIAKLSKRKLIIAGIIQDEEYFQAHVKPHVDDDQITYVGNVGPERRNELLGQAAALLHPIQFNEPFGLSIVEAMACGTPVIAFKRGSMAELIVENKTGFLVKTVEEAAHAVDQLGDIQREDCRHQVEEKFTVDRMIDGYLEVYQQILNQ